MKDSLFSNQQFKVFLKNVPESEVKRSKQIFEYIMESSESNSHLNKHKHVFSEEMQLYSVYLFLTSGRRAYEDLVANFKRSLPCSTTVRNYISKKRNIEEGKLDFQGMISYLTSQECPPVIVLSEDQTRIWSKIKYDPKTRCLVGFVSTHGSNGMPLLRHFSVSSAAEIYNFFKNYKKAAYINLIMAQPLKIGITPFCLAAYGSDNKFTYLDVRKRWKFIYDQCNSIGVRVLVNAGDGDSRILKESKFKLGLGISAGLEERPWFLVKIYISFLNRFLLQKN